MDSLLISLRDFANADGLRLVLVGVAIVAATMVVSHALVKLIRRALQIDGNPLPSSSIIVNIARIAVWMMGVYTLLSVCFNVDVNGLVAALGIGGVALSLGLQDTLKNFIGGLQVTLMRIVKPGDHVVVNGVDGIVRDVNWRQTVVVDYELTTHIIPNAIISSSGVAQVEPSRLVASTFVMNTDARDLRATLREMERLAKEAVEQVAPLERDPWILVTQIGEFGVNCKMRFVLADVAHAREARDAALCAVAPYTRGATVKAPIAS